MRLPFLKILLLAFAALPFPVQATNPFLPGWEYIPDGEPRVFGDRVYLYGSHDRAGSQEFCDTLLRVWSAPLADLNTWTDHGIIFTTREVEGRADDVPWSDNNLYAPEVIKKGDRYYLFAQIVGAPCAVAVSDSPVGPFHLVSQIKKPEGSPIDFGGWSQYFDPGVLVDDDGKVYLYWGGGSSHIARLNPANLTEILPDTYQANILPTTPPFNYQEGPSPRKINGLYYIVFAAGNDLAYATSTSPTGPFTYRGVIVSHTPDAPGGNIHGGLAELNGQWYIFYHRMTHNTVFSRRACAEPVTILPDGSIPQVEQTSLGFRTSLDPYQTTPADIACVLRGGNYVTELDLQTRPVINNTPGAVIGFRTFDFGQPAALSVSLRIRGASTPTRIKIQSARPGEAPVEIGSLQITPDASAQWRDVSAELLPVSGRAAIFFTFVSDTPNQPVSDLLSFRFSPTQSPSAP
jgi:hypothetical protein